MTKARSILVRVFLSMLLAPIVPSLTWGAEASAQLKLTEAVTEALEKNPEIQLLRQRLDVVSARSKQAPYLEDPEIAFQLRKIETRFASRHERRADSLGPIGRYSTDLRSSDDPR